MHKISNTDDEADNVVFITITNTVKKDEVIQLVLDKADNFFNKQKQNYL